MGLKVNCHKDQTRMDHLNLTEENSQWNMGEKKEKAVEQMENTQWGQHG